MFLGIVLPGLDGQPLYYMLRDWHAKSCTPCLSCTKRKYGETPQLFALHTTNVCWRLHWDYAKIVTPATTQTWHTALLRVQHDKLCAFVRLSRCTLCMREVWLGRLLWGVNALTISVSLKCTVHVIPLIFNHCTMAHHVPLPNVSFLPSPINWSCCIIYKGNLCLCGAVPLCSKSKYGAGSWPSIN